MGLWCVGVDEAENRNSRGSGALLFAGKASIQAHPLERAAVECGASIGRSQRDAMRKKVSRLLARSGIAAYDGITKRPIICPPSVKAVSGIGVSLQKVYDWIGGGVKPTAEQVLALLAFLASRG